MKKVYQGELYERHAAELCLRLALKKLEEEDFELAAHRAEEAIRSIKELQQIKNRSTRARQPANFLHQ